MMAKYIYTCFILFICNSITTNAQESHYGMRLGANLSSISSDDITDEQSDSRIGAIVGFFAEYSLTEKISIQPEIQYSAQGNKEKTLRVNYIQVPVIFKYNITPIFNVQLGPQAGIKIWEWERNQNYNTFDFAGVAGIGANVTDHFFVDLRYAYGLSNVFDDSELPISIEGNNTNFQLTVGYRL